MPPPPRHPNQIPLLQGRVVEQQESCVRGSVLKIYPIGLEHFKSLVDFEVNKGSGV